MKKLIFFALNAATYCYFYTDEYTLSRKGDASSHFQRFIGFMNLYEINDSRPLSIFKDYETHRINIDGVKGISTGLREIQNALKSAIVYEPFTEGISREDVALLHKATEIPKLRSCTPGEQLTLCDWFGEHTWLRQDDIGIGHELYSRLASPKALCKSLVSTAVATLAELQRLRDTLYSFVLESDWKPSDFPPLKERSEFKNEGDYGTYRRRYFNKAMRRIQKDYHAYSGDKQKVKELLLFLFTETVTPSGLEVFTKSFFQSEELTLSYVANGRRMPCAGQSSNYAATTIGFPLIAEMVLYIQDENEASSVKPITKVEQIMFCWLMAYLTVQPSDITKLTKSAFTFVKRRSGQVTHIDIRYYKGRSGGNHDIETVATNKALGVALQRFIEESTNNLSSDDPLVDYYPTIRTGSTLQRLALFWDSHMREAIEQQIVTDGASPVFLEAVIALENNGIKYSYRRDKNVKVHRSNTKIFLNRCSFSLTHIKNSSVHARSDKFDPTQLMNYHSHTNTTERGSYLTSENEVWLNNTGRITRMVMLDIASNLYTASNAERKIFNKQFSQASQHLHSGKEDILSRIKVITGKKSGSINDFGFVKNPNDIDGFEDQLYLLDSPETVLKLLHYLHEVRKNHHLLMGTSSEYLLFTVLPTVEWIETVFDHKMLSRSSVEKGEKLFSKYKDDLPSLFTAYIG